MLIIGVIPTSGLDEQQPLGQWVGQHERAFPTPPARQSLPGSRDRTERRDLARCTRLRSDRDDPVGALRIRGSAVGRSDGSVTSMPRRHVLPGAVAGAIPARL